MRAKNFRLRLFVLTLVILSAPATFAQGDRLGVEYTVEVKDKAERLFHITTHLRNIRQPRLALSLPVWTPGWYTVENYAKNILRFTVTDARGQRLPHRMSRKQTWDVETKGLSEIKVDFDYRADVLGLNQAKIADDFAFFTGTQLFLEPVGHRAAPSTVRFRVPAGWKIVSALDETRDPHVFTATDYDALVDAPTEMGHFDVTRFEVEGKPHYFVATPAGAFNAEKSRQFTAMFDKFARAQGAIFGGLPYEKYVAFYFFMPAESNAAGAVEHANSYVAFAPSGEVATPDMILGTAAHEFFHLWNVKRFRPAEMWPYDYSREQETPLLWVSEGLTNYYTNVSLLRSGLRRPEQFLESVSNAITNNESDEARPYISPADASTSTWLGYDTPVAFGISYYTQGQNLGALLDLSIRHDTAGRASLDDVMRALYSDFYLRGRGFTTDDLLAVIKRVAGRDYTDFFRRHVFGVEVPPYDRILGHAGYRLEKSARKTPHLGILNARPAQGGLELVRLEPNSPATRAGLAPGDVILKIDGADFRAFSLGDSAGKTVALRYKRAGEEKETGLDIGTLDETSYRIAELPNPSAEQLKIRAGWMNAGK
ncbi:MAG TPA: PDZ domain-containing protein [Pyrinomonadaceae bacterium]